MSIRHKLLGGISAIAFAGILSFGAPSFVGAQEDMAAQEDKCAEYKDADALGFLEQDIPDECKTEDAGDDEDLFADFMDEGDSDSEEDLFADDATDEEDLFGGEDETAATGEDTTDDGAAGDDVADAGDTSDDPAASDDPSAEDEEDNFDDLFADDTTGGTDTDAGDDLFGDATDDAASGDDVAAADDGDSDSLDDPSASGDVVASDDVNDDGSADGLDGDLANSAVDDAVSDQTGSLSFGPAGANNGSVIAVTVGQGLANLANDPTSITTMDSLADVVVGNDPAGGSKNNVAQVSALQVFDGGENINISVLEAIGGNLDPMTALLGIDASRAPSGAPSGLPTPSALVAIPVNGAPGSAGTDAVLEVGLPLLDPVADATGLQEITVLEVLGGNMDPTTMLINLKGLTDGAGGGGGAGPTGTPLDALLAPLAGAAGGGGGGAGPTGTPLDIILLQIPGLGAGGGGAPSPDLILGLLPL